MQSPSPPCPGGGGGGVGAGACTRAYKHTKHEFKFRCQPGSQALSQLLRQQKGPCSCCFFTRHAGRKASASHATELAGGGNRLGTLSPKEKCLCPRSALSPVPPVAPAGKPGCLGQCMQPHLLNHFSQGEMENPTLPGSQRRLHHKLISPLSLQNFTFIWCKLLQ